MEDATSVVPDLDEIGLVLAALLDGERAWFWWCAGATAPGLPMLATPLSLDPKMARLRTRIARNPRPDEARAITGLVHATPDGLHLISHGATADDLAQIAAWVQAHHEAYPDLRRLRGLSLRAVSASGTVTAVFEDDALWASVPAADAADLADHAAEVLDDLYDGDEAWFWMSPRGSDGRACLVLSARDSDRRSQRFAALVRDARQRGAVAEGSLQGIARRDGETVALITTVAAKGWADTVAALIGQHGARFQDLSGCALRYMKGGAVKKTIPLPPHRDLAETVALLTSGGGWFWFTTAASHGGPLLVVRPDRERLKAAAVAAGGSGKSARGRLEVDSGAVTFVTSKGDGVRDAIMAWAREEARRWPGLRRLKGATVRSDA